jgi:UDP-3-O-[3-hydroxymyristoyl] glucosamine N-acyltransferase
MPISLGELATRFSCELIGDPDIIVDDVAPLSNASSSSLSFLSSSAFKKQLSSTKAAAVILSADDAPDSPTAALVHDNPYACYARIAAFIRPRPAHAAGVHATAVVAETASVASTSHVAANAVIEDRAVIGENSYIGPGTVVGPDCIVGDDCRLNANVTFVRNVSIGEGWVSVPQFGGVRIGNDVEVGASTTIDCGAIEDTIIENGVRLDNQIQIGHNVHVGEHTAMASSVAVAGSAHIGKRCLLAGMVGVAGHITICDDVIINGKGMVSKSITEPGGYASNFPVEGVRTWNRRVAMFRRIDKLLGRVSKLEKDNK